MTYEILIYKL